MTVSAPRPSQTSGRVFAEQSHFSPPVDRVMVEERARSLASRSIKKSSKVAGLRLAIGLMDLTTLEGADSEGKIRALCQKARFPNGPEGAAPAVAAVCVYPALVATARRALEGSSVRVASVAAGFPLILSVY